MPTEPLKTDFQALRVLVCVHRLASFRAAADELGMTQSSVSYAVDRLREVFDDPLFVRLGRSVAPTARCEQVVAGAEELLRGFEALTVSDSFDPARATDRFVLSCNFYERSLFLPPLMAELTRAAPGVRLSVIQAGASGHRQLEAGACDLVVAPLGAHGAGIRRQRLLTERYGCFVAQDHPLAARGMSLADYAAARHVLVRPASGWRPRFHDALDRLGLAIAPVLEVPSFAELQRIIAGSDLMLTATAGLRRVFGPEVASVPAPFDCTFPVEMSWSGRTHEAPAHRWFRGLVAAIAARIAAEDAAPGITRASA